MTDSSWIARWGLVLVLAAIAALFSLLLPDTFPTWSNVHDIIVAQPPLVFIAFAALITLVVGQFDLSLGANLGVCQYLVMQLMVTSHVAWPLAVILAIAAGVAIGAFNALFVVGFGLNSFIVTIGVATILEGLLQLLSNGGNPIFGGAPQGFLDLGQTELLGLTLPVFYALVAAIVLWLVLERTVLGRQLRATGANSVASVLSGIPTKRATVTAFLLAGAMAGFAGVLASARIGASDATSGPSYLLPAFAAAFLGATAVRPGFFNVWGTVIAIFLVAVGITGLQLEGVESWVTPVFNGVVLLIAIGVSQLASTWQKRGRSDRERHTQGPAGEAESRKQGDGDRGSMAPETAPLKES